MNFFWRFPPDANTFIELGNEFADLQMHIPHITSPTFYRLRIPSLLENYDKCIYLDGDTIVCEDLQRLYNIDLQDNYLGGVPAYGYYKKEAEHRKRLELSDDQTFQYFNAGVLLINLDKLREDKKEDQFLQLIEKDYTSQDQDILNIACYGKIQLLSYRYNVMTKYVKWKLETFPSQVMPYDIISGHMYPVIIHYADKVKPWNDCTSPYSNLWFSVAMTDICWDFFSDILVLKNTYVEQKKQAERLRNDLNGKKKEVVALQHALDCVHNSVSFRIGRGITYLPRKLRDLSTGDGKVRSDKQFKFHK